MRKSKIVKAFVLMFIIQGYAYAASPTLETWDNGLLNDWRENTSRTTVEARSTGGNPKGWLFSYGFVTGSFDIGALTQQSVFFTGDYLLTPIRRVSVDISFISGSFDAAWVRFRYKDSAHNGWLYPLTTSFPTDGWHEYTVDFDPTWTDTEAGTAGWITDRDRSPTALPSEPFTVTMSDVFTAEVRLSGEGFLEAGIDNFQIAAHKVIGVNIDIKPKYCPNKLYLNCKWNKILKVAILGTETFNVSDIDIDTIRLEGVSPFWSIFWDITAPSALELCDCEALNGDTYEDLVLCFKKKDIVDALGNVNNGDEIPLTLTAKLQDGTEIEGSDCVLIETKKWGWKKWLRKFKEHGYNHWDGKWRNKFRNQRR